jgi:NADPH:quinone reductase-like Zn-dependent oxidoreductase
VAWLRSRWRLRRWVAEVPDSVDLARAAVAGGALTTAGLLLEHVARVRPGDVVLVHSAGGGVGQALAQLAPLTGVERIVGTVGRPQRVASARAAGYDAVLVRDDSLAQALREETGGHGADVILDPQGTDLLELDLGLAAPGARVVLFGNAAGGTLGPLPPAGALFAGNLMIGGSACRAWPSSCRSASQARCATYCTDSPRVRSTSRCTNSTASSRHRAATTSWRRGRAPASVSSASAERRHAAQPRSPRSRSASRLRPADRTRP